MKYAFFCRIVSDGPDFVCGERPPIVRTLTLDLFCNQQPKPPKNERKMIPLFCSTNRRRYPVWLNLKNQQINLNFLPKVKDCCPVIIKLWPCNGPNQPVKEIKLTFFKEKFSCTKIIPFVIEHWQPWKNLRKLCYESYATRIDHWNIMRLPMNYF